MAKFIPCLCFFVTRALTLPRYICPLTRFLMVDPVIAEDERTYERAAIEAHLATRATSPLDPSLAVRPDRLIANRAVKTAIERLVETAQVSGGSFAVHFQLL